MNKSLLLFVASLIYSNFVYAIDLGSTPGNVTDRIVARISNIDDVGVVYVVNERTLNLRRFEPVVQCQWQGSNCSSSGSLSGHLTDGVNYIIFGCYNKVFNGLWGGKWSYSFSLVHDGNTVWRASNHVRNNTEGLKYTSAIKAVVRNGSVTISQNFSRAEANVLSKIEIGIERSLEGSGTANWFDGVLKEVN